MTGLLRQLAPLLPRRSLGVVDPLLRLVLDVGLLRESRDRLAEFLARLGDLAADLLLRLVDHRRAVWTLAFVHRTSSFTLSVACSGTGGVACATFFLPLRASTAAPAASTT